MALPATFLPNAASEPKARGLRAHELKTAAQLQAALEFQSAERVLALGIPELDEALPQGGLLQGSVTELQVRGAGGAATSFALCACRAAQTVAAGWNGSLDGQSLRKSAAPLGESVPWCVFIDPSASLYAPGVAELGVELGRLLVVRPEIDAVERVAVRIAEARAVGMLVVDLRGALGGLSSRRGTSPRTSNPNLQGVVRRLALCVQNLATCVLLITDAGSPRALPLPVAMRLEFARASESHFEVRVAKERTGRVSSPRLVPWSAFKEAAS